MNIPKYILKALGRRARAAESFNTNDLIISKFIDKHNIEIESYDYHGGVESIVNPYNSAKRVALAILNKNRQLSFFDSEEEDLNGFNLDK